MKKLLIVLGSSALVVLILIAVVYSRFSTLAEKYLAKQLPAETRVVAPEEFVLQVGEEVPTVEAGPSTYHRLWANKSYQAVSVQLDGRRILYNMPAGWESWIGDEPAGRLRLIGKEENTVVKIYRRS